MLRTLVLLNLLMLGLSALSVYNIKLERPEHYVISDAAWTATGE